MIDVCIVSYVTKELEIFPDGTQRPIVAGPGYFVATTLKHLDKSYRVLMVTKVSREDWDLIEELLSYDIEVVNTFTLNTMKSKLIYHKDGSRSIEVLSTANPFTDEDIDICVDARPRIIYLGPLTTRDFEFHHIVELARASKLFIDIQGFTRRVVVDRIEYVDWPYKAMASKYVDILKLDDREGYLLTGYRDPKAIISMLNGYGYKDILLTTSEGVWIYTENKLYFERYRVDKVIGRTGRGDTAVAAYIYTKLSRLPIDQAVKFVAVATGIKLKQIGPLKISKEEVMKYIETD